MKFDHIVPFVRSNISLNRLVSTLFFILAWSISGCTSKTASTADTAPTSTGPIPSTNDSLLPDSHLKVETVQQLFLIAGEYRSQEGSQEIIEYGCTIIEGTFCWFAEEDLGGALYGLISKDLARTVVNDVGASVIDQAKTMNSLFVVRSQLDRINPSLVRAIGGGKTSGSLSRSNNVARAK